MATHREGGSNSEAHGIVKGGGGPVAGSACGRRRWVTVGRQETVLVGHLVRKEVHGPLQWLIARPPALGRPEETVPFQIYSKFSS
jgi:hypothetical protein